MKGIRNAKRRLRFAGLSPHVAWRAAAERHLNGELSKLAHQSPNLHALLVKRADQFVWAEAVRIEMRRPGRGMEALLRMACLIDEASGEVEVQQ